VHNQRLTPYLYQPDGKDIIVERPAYEFPRENAAPSICSLLLDGLPSLNSSHRLQSYLRRLKAVQPSVIISHPIGHFSALLTDLSASIVGFPFRRTRLSITSFLGRLSLKTRYGILFSLACAVFVELRSKRGIATKAQSRFALKWCRPARSGGWHAARVRH